MIGGVCNASDGVVLPPRARAQRCYPKFAITSTVGGLRSSEGSRTCNVEWCRGSRVSGLVAQESRARAARADASARARVVGSTVSDHV